jgi:hypothetical protein
MIITYRYRVKDSRATPQGARFAARGRVSQLRVTRLIEVDRGLTVHSGTFARYTI